jgi:hypothetical protein
MRKLLLPIIVLLGSSEAAGGSTEVSYLCISDQSTGFALDKTRGQWSQANFAPGQKLIIRKITKTTVAEFAGGIKIPLTGAWAVWKFGDDKQPFATCDRDFNANGSLFCDGESELHFRFNRQNGRFIAGTLYGYTPGAVHSSGIAGVAGAAVDWPDGSNTPFMEIGLCSTI